MPTDELHKFISEKLTERSASGLLRKPGKSGGTIDFASNDYLGLARSEELAARIEEKRKHLTGYKNGATGSRLLTGNNPYTEAVEQKLASIFNAASCLLFNSGYTANLAVLSSLPQKGDTILYDDLAHASIKDGTRLSLATRFNFRHNDLTDLEKKMRRSDGKIFVVVESIYSMDGDEAPLAKLADLCTQYHAHLVVDEAHSTGVIGQKGSGLVVSLGLEEKVAVRIYTFGKAMGIHGACVAGAEKLSEYLVNFARPFIYTTALPPHDILSIDCAFDYLANNMDLQQKLQQRIDLFRRLVPDALAHTDSRSAIQTVIIPGNKEIKEKAHALEQQGFDVRPVLSPTVPVGTERFRLCLHTYNTEEEITALTSALEKFI